MNTLNKKEDLIKLRHSAAHLLAHAIKELYPKTILTIGPATKDGFFYDILPAHNFKEEDLPKIATRMHEIAARNLPITHEQMLKNEARQLFTHNPFKLELIEGIPGDTVGISRQGNFYDLCRGGHVDTTGDIQFFTLLNISGSYWRADRNNQALQRITGTAFFSQEELNTYFTRKEEALKNDHRKLGKQLDLFSFHDEGVGFPFFHPKGKIVLNELIAYLRSLQNTLGYQEIQTPIMLSKNLWKRSGHYDHYRENMYFCTKDDETYAIKPMNCPGAFLLYNERQRSYRELPLRYSEFGLVHRHELSGVLHGLMRARAFTQDDAHIMCTFEQLEDEILNTIKLTFTVFTQFFPEIKVALSTKPENAMGENHMWEKALDSLHATLKRAGIEFTVQEGEGAFYGPKIEFLIKDSMNREWQCGTIQVDFFQPENFDLFYISSQGKKERPVVLHRVVYGSLERFFAILLEHYKGHLPFWLSPVQIKILTITDEQKEYATKILHKCHTHGLRTSLDESSDQISSKIKAAQLEKVPWMLIIGNKEVANNTVTIRYNDGKQKLNISLDKLLDEAKQNIPLA